MAELKNRRRRTASIVLVAGLTVAGSGVAYAYWTAQGSGVGSAETGLSAAFTVTSDPPDEPLLAPGSDPGQTIAFTVTNGTTGALVASDQPPPAFATCPPTPTTTTSAEPSQDNSLTITQTSTMANLAPGRPPADIVGRVVNNGPDSTFVTAIRVAIVGVTKKVGAARGTCDASDYVLVDPLMPVGRPLASGGGSSDFRGAAIGFNNKSTNQDACQGATVKLRYTAVPR